MTLLLKIFQRRTLPDFVIWVHNKYMCPRQTKHRKHTYNTFYLFYNFFHFETKSMVELVPYPVLNKMFSFWYLFIILQVFKFWSSCIWFLSKHLSWQKFISQLSVRYDLQLNPMSNFLVAQVFLQYSEYITRYLSEHDFSLKVIS